MKWSKHCAISEVSRTVRAVLNTNPVEYGSVAATTGARFQLNNAKLYVPVVTLSINDINDIKEQFLGTNTDLK